MVNYQSNHALDALQQPANSLGYAPLFTCAAACKGWDGRLGNEYRQGSVRALLHHGARIDMMHGKKSAMQWVSDMGSPQVAWLEELQADPAPDRAEYCFSRGNL